MNKKRIIIFTIIFSAFEALNLIMGSIFFSKTNLAFKNAELNLLQEESNFYECDNYFLNYDFDINENSGYCEKYFLQTYSNNFSKSSTTLLSISDNNRICKFETTFNNNVLPFKTAALSGVNYTNNQELVRFETFCINLLCFREKSIELFFEKDCYDGFIYIPDYYADYILQQYLPLGNYYDLLENKDLNFVSLKFGENFFKYKIANIFHVNGFNFSNMNDKKYTYNDYNTGKKIDSFFNGYCIVSNFRSFDKLSPSLHTTIVTQIDSKKFMLDETLTLMNSFRKVNHIDKTSVEIFHSSENRGVYISKYNDVWSAYSAPSVFSWKEALGCILLIFNLLIPVLLYAGWLPIKANFKTILILLITNFVYLVCSFFFKKIISPSFYAGIFFNSITSLFSVLTIVILLFLCYLIKFKNKEGENGFEKNV